MNLILTIALLFAVLPAPISPMIVFADGNYGAMSGGSLPLLVGGEAIYKMYLANNDTVSHLTAQWKKPCWRGALTISADEIGADGGVVMVSFLLHGRKIVTRSATLKQFSTKTIKAPMIYNAVIITNAADVEAQRNNRTMIYFSKLECGK
jgi:hypothetical protein